jgi:Glycosyltransferase (GlcNAc)
VTIFVSIAAYRDSQLGPTVRDCLANADRPDELRFGICWQHAPDEPWPLGEDPRFRVIDVDHRDSRGVCWARAQIGRLVDGEDWFLQLDSHHRFAPGWDTALIELAEGSGCPKPLLTTYPTGFTLPDEGKPRNQAPWMISFGRWHPAGFPLYRPRVIPGWQDLSEPRRARFIGACFIFTQANWAAEVPYDPELYFDGEEITLAVRSFTWGYDFFHPPRTLVWHEWSRSYRPKHYGDHTRESGTAFPVEDLQSHSEKKVRSFMREPYIGPFGCGRERTAEAYQAYSGLDLMRCRVQDYTLQNGEPPNPPADPDWAAQPRPWRVIVLLAPDWLDPLFVCDGADWTLTLSDPDGEIISTATRPASQAQATGSDDRLVVAHTFVSARTPVWWTLSTSVKEDFPAYEGSVDGVRRRGDTAHMAYIDDSPSESAGSTR